MPKQCLAKGCNYDVFSNKYCKFHQWMRPDKMEKAYKPKKRKKIKVISDSMRAKYAKYRPLRDKYMVEHPDCEICGNRSQDLHHKAGRVGDLMSNIDYFMAVCRKHHNWIHENPKEAREKGYLI